VVFSTIPAAPPNRPSGTSIDLAPWDELAADPDNLVGALDGLLLHNTISPEMRESVINAVATIPASNRRLRVRTAVYLILTSSQYQVQR
jgi:hypothetical protein